LTFALLQRAQGAPFLDSLWQGGCINARHAVQGLAAEAPASRCELLYGQVIFRECRLHDW
jgi:hypothetical protein